MGRTTKAWTNAVFPSMMLGEVDALTRAYGAEQVAQAVTWRTEVYPMPETVTRRSLSTVEPTKEIPLYRKVLQEEPSATSLYMVVVDEGWRTSILGTNMYGWAADWLVNVLQGRPYAPGNPS